MSTLSNSQGSSSPKSHIRSSGTYKFHRIFGCSPPPRQDVSSNDWTETKKKRKKVLSKVKHASDAKLAFGREVTHGDWGLRAALLWRIQNLFLACDSPENGRWAHLDLSKNWGCYRRRWTSLLCSLKWRCWQLCDARKREDSISRGGLKGRKPHLQWIPSVWEAWRWASGEFHCTQSRILHGRGTCQLFWGPDAFYLLQDPMFWHIFQCDP